MDKILGMTIIKYTWQQVDPNGRLFSTTRGFFDTETEAMAHFGLPREAFYELSDDNDVITIGDHRWHLTMIIIGEVK